MAGQQEVLEISPNATLHQLAEIISNKYDKPLMFLVLPNNDRVDPITDGNKLVSDFI